MKQRTSLIHMAPLVGKALFTRSAAMALLLGVYGATQGRAEGFAIQSLDGTGRLTFTAVAGATNYEVRTSSTLTGGWSVAKSVVPTAAHALTTTVSMAGSARFYKVVAYTNTVPEWLYQVIDLSGGTSAVSYPVSYLSAVPSGGWTDEYKTTKLVMRRIPAGTFTMGSPSNELGRYVNETQHQVTLTRDFCIGVFEVTQRQWELVMGNRPSYFNNSSYYTTRPVEQVSYYEIRENPNNSAISPNWPQSNQVNATSFIGRLRAKTGLQTLDLPTEAQWEYACRAGTTTALNSGTNLTSKWSCPNLARLGRYWDNGGYLFSQGCDPSGGTAKVGSYVANQWGLYDMHGNVGERCLDWDGAYPGTVTDPLGATSGTGRTWRGGGWYNDAYNCRSAVRFGITPDSRTDDDGLRLSRTLP